MQHQREQAYIDYQEQHQGRALSGPEARTLVQNTLKGWQGRANLPVEWQRSYLEGQWETILSAQRRYALQLPRD